MAKHSSSFPDHNQNFWQLSCIISASQNIVMILIGGTLSKQYGPATAISSICIGNLILWLIGLAMISMTAKERRNAIENVKEHLGKTGSFLISVILIVAFLSWYMIEIQSVTSSITPLLASATQKTLVGSSLGLGIAILAMGGIRLIKHLTVTAFPFLLSYILYGMFTSALPSFGPIGIEDFSFPATIIVVSLTLPGMVNLPTFFRHSKSQTDSFLALTLITIFDILFEIYSVFTQMTDPAEISAPLNSFSQHIPYATITLAFIGISSICLNLVNIYFASAALQNISKKITGPWGFLLVGLMGTVSYALLQNSLTMEFLEIVSSNFIANLGVMLVLSLITSVIVKHRPRVFEKNINLSCWLLGCLVTLITQITYPQSITHSLLLGSTTIILAFITILFFEETIWSIKKIHGIKQK